MKNQISVMTFNLRYATANDGGNRWEFRKNALFQTIANHSPTIIGTQEGLKDQLNEIINNLKHYDIFGSEREKNGEFSAILYDKTKLDLLDGGNFWLSETPEIFGSRSWDTACTRMATWAKFQIRSTDHKFYLFNSHFDHVSELARQKSGLLIWERSKKIDLPIFLTGDFNTHRGGLVWQFLTGKMSLEDQIGNFSDAFDLAKDRGRETIRTYHSFRGLASESIDGVSGSEHIDWILFRSGSETPVLARCFSVIVDQIDDYFPSDHYPILAEFDL